MASNDRIMTNSTDLPQGFTLAHGRTVADNAGGGEGPRAPGYAQPLAGEAFQFVLSPRDDLWDRLAGL
jgi:hypothetical protein